MRCPEIKGNNCVLDQYGDEDHADSGDEYFGSALNWIVHTNVLGELYIQLFWENCTYNYFVRIVFTNVLGRIVHTG